MAFDKKSKAEGEADWPFTDINDNTTPYVLTLKTLFVFGVITDIEVAELLKQFDLGSVAFAELHKQLQPVLEALPTPLIPEEEKPRYRRK